MKLLHFSSEDGAQKKAESAKMRLSIYGLAQNLSQNLKLSEMVFSGKHITNEQHCQT